MFNRSINLKALLPFIIALFLIILFVAMMEFFYIKINLTPSMPIGLYRQLPTTKIDRGDIVSACLPLAIAKHGLARGYLTKGRCPGGSIAVLKKIIAIPGDTVQLTTKSMKVNNRRYPAPQHTQDSSGNVIIRWIHNGTYKNVTGYWLYGNHSPNLSWDSRYYGSLSRSNIYGVYKPLLIFSSRSQ